MRLAALVMLSCVLLACTGPSPGKAGDPGAGAPGDGGGFETAGDERLVITDEPTTVEVTLSEEVRQHLERRLDDGSLEVVRLVIRDLEPRSASALKGVRLFIDRPDADRDTPVDDPHYAGNFVLGLEDRQSMLWNIAPVLGRIWSAADLAEKRTFQVTFVPEPWDFADELPEDFSLPFASLEVQLPEP